MTYSCFDVQYSDHVAHMRLTRPEAFNAMNRAFWAEFPQIITEISGSAKARALVLSSTGKHFCAGMDLAVFAEADAGHPTPGGADVERRQEAFLQRIYTLQRAFSVLEEARMPVIAAVQGGCVGGGLDLVSACDIRVCTADAFFCIQEINLGIVPDVGTFPRLNYLIPQGLLRELAFTGRRLPAAEAKSAGLVNAVFADQAAMIDHALSLAREIATKSPLAIYGAKRMMNYARDHTVGDCLDYVALWQAAMDQGTDLNESMRAKTEKRSAQFADLKPLPKRV